MWHFFLFYCEICKQNVDLNMRSKLDPNMDSFTMHALCTDQGHNTNFFFLIRLTAWLCLNIIEEAVGFAQEVKVFQSWNQINEGANLDNWKFLRYDCSLKTKFAWLSSLKISKVCILPKFDSFLIPTKLTRLWISHEL